MRPSLRLPAPAYPVSAAVFAPGVNFRGWKIGAVRALGQNLVAPAG
jgi:hypothetical protein